MNVFADRIRQVREYGQILKCIDESKKRKRHLPMMITGLCEGALDAFLAALACDKKGVLPFLIIVHDEKNAFRLASVLRAFDYSVDVFPSREPVLYDIVSSHELEHERIEVLRHIIDATVDIVITTPDAALSYTIPREKLTAQTRTYCLGDTLDLETFRSELVSAGYVFADLVDGVGQFSVRGGIVDIYPPQTDGPVRFELFGDEIDQIGTFDIFSQRKVRQLTDFTICPTREFVPDAEARALITLSLESLIKKAQSPETAASLSHELASLKSSDDLPFADKYMSVIHPENQTLLDYFTDESVVAMTETGAVAEKLKTQSWHISQEIEQLLKDGLIQPKYASYYADEGKLYAFLERNSALLINNFQSQYHGKLNEMFIFQTRKTPTVIGNMSALADDLRSYISAGSAVVILCSNATEVQSLSDLLNDEGITYSAVTHYSNVAEALPKIPVITCFDCEGFEIIGGGFAVLSFGECDRKRKSAYKRSEKKDGKSSKEKILSYADLQVGDYVVHDMHGIGRYMGIESILSYNGVRSDHIKIVYSGSGVLYVPCEKIDQVAKYIGVGSDDDNVKLSKLGGGEWERTKSRVSREVKNMAKELISLYAERMRRPGFAFSPDDAMQREFESMFEYDETDGQLEATRDIKNDMERPVPMDRLLCGDVGFGKTEVALRAAFKAVENSKQVAILVPTTILAMQHYNTIVSRMRAFPVNVGVLSRFRSTKEQQATVHALARGDIDIIVGTHRLLSQDVSFRDLGLVIIDEEQRFGVSHKEKLKQLAHNVDVLTLTATPIPRTLNMAMSDIRDMSVLDEAPQDRLPVQTYVFEHDDIIVFDAIRRELARGGQVFYLFNNIETIGARAAKIKKEFPDAVVEVAHGQMDKEQLSDIWQSLVAGQIDVLVCTTIIETGVDVPNANTLIIENADRMGLSQLHQIRGRVGRSSRRAYAYFTYPRGKAISEIATKRLQAIRDYTEFGAGFKIALRDLEIRGAGDVLGASQSGHMASVGYDMYVRILNAAILEEKGIPEPKTVECTVNVGRDSFIPESYVPNAAQRIDIYKKIARIRNDEDADDIRDELTDRYGYPPQSVETLIQASLVRRLGSDCGFTLIERKMNDIVIYPQALDIVAWSEMAAALPGRIVITPSSRPYVTCRGRKNEQIFPLIFEIFKIYTQIKSKKE
ncbi:MAG: transcription-repair coupling factor [Clostridia bacterium]|nr:transcription-repair coupling factor [Clostridia bacterium]